MKQAYISVLLVLLANSGFSQTLECDLLRQQIITLNSQIQVNPCDRDYELCMAKARGQFEGNTCFNMRNACNGGRQLGQGLSDALGVKSQQQVNLENMLNVYKLNCERTR